MAKAKDLMEDSFEGGDGSVMINMDDVDAASDELLPKGDYVCTIETCEYKLSQSSGQPMWAHTLVVNDGEYEGRKLFSNMSFSPKALPITKKTLADIAPEFTTGSFNPEESASDMEGKIVKAKVVHTKYEGEMRSSVKKLSAAGGMDDFMNG